MQPFMYLMKKFLPYEIMTDSPLGQMADSPLGGSCDAPAEDSVAAGPYRGLKVNAKARGRRQKKQFFDSADWAMKGAKEESQPNASPALSQLDGDNKDESPLAGSGAEQASPLSG